MTGSSKNINISDIRAILSGRMKELKEDNFVVFEDFNVDENVRETVLLVEFTGVRVADIDEIRESILAQLKKAAVLAIPQKIEVVRPNWLCRDNDGKISIDKSRKKYRLMKKLRGRDRLWITDYGENVSKEQKDSFAYFGTETKLRTPTNIISPQHIQIGNWVSLGRYGKIIMQTDFSALKLYAKQHYPAAKHDFDKKIYGPRSPFLKIGDGTAIGDHFFISCALSVEIGKHVLFSDRVFISDANHLYSNLALPVSLQAISPGKPVIIGDHSFIGINVVVLEGVKIGKHAVIGANTVVTEDVPDFSVFVGNPGRVVKMIRPES